MSKVGKWFDVVNGIFPLPTYITFPARVAKAHH